MPKAKEEKKKGKTPIFVHVLCRNSAPNEQLNRPLSLQD